MTNNKYFIKKTYNPKKYVFENCDEVISFLSNLNEIDEAKIISNTKDICEIETKTRDGLKYKYQFDFNSKMLISLDE